MRRGSWVARKFLNKARPDHLFSSEYQKGFMSGKSKAESIQNVKMLYCFVGKS